MSAAAVGCSSGAGDGPSEQPLGNAANSTLPTVGANGNAGSAPAAVGQGQGSTSAVAPSAGAGGSAPGTGTPTTVPTGAAAGPSAGAGGTSGSIATTPPVGGAPAVGAGGAAVGGATAGGGGAAGSSNPMAAVPCNLNTGYEGDDKCIMPPPPDKGYQLHIGPSNYQNPEAAYVLQPGQEETTDFPATSTNDTDVYFFYRQYRLRPTTHHAIITAGNVGGIAGLGRIATANASGEYPANGITAPEDTGVGIKLAAHASIDVSFHTINTSATPQLRELWINFWYKDASQVTQPATEWFNIGDPLFSVPPHTSTTLGPYTCNVSGTGRLLWLYGHRHANNTRFTVTRIRGTQKDVIYDADNWEEPLLLNYSSLVTNPAPDIANGVEGGWSGILPMQTGDVVQWSCNVTNNNNTALTFTEQTYLGEMCIVDAEGVGVTCQ
ncbi:MAG TPA: hypothetical protein VHC69_34140 [Polyangiaceae bacterium]|nr:hypothetical protein [Polyangiaceae bacterium]